MRTMPPGRNPSRPSATPSKLAVIESALGTATSGGRPSVTLWFPPFRTDANHFPHRRSPSRPVGRSRSIRCAGYSPLTRRPAGQSPVGYIGRRYFLRSQGSPHHLPRFSVPRRTSRPRRRCPAPPPAPRDAAETGGSLAGKRGGGPISVPDTPKSKPRPPPEPKTGAAEARDGLQRSAEG